MSSIGIVTWFNFLTPQLSGIRIIAAQNISYQVTPNSPSVLHVREFDDFQSIAQDFLAESTKLYVGVVTSSRHKHLKQRITFKHLAWTFKTNECTLTLSIDI